MNIKVFFIGLFSLSIFCLSGCSKKVDTYSPESVRNEAMAAFQDYIIATDKGDIELAASYYLDTKNFHWIESGNLQYASVGDAEESLKSITSNGSDIDVSVADIKATDLSETSALVSGSFDLIFKNESGETTFSTTGWMSVAMVKREGRWQIAGGHSSSAN